MMNTQVEKVNPSEYGIEESKALEITGNLPQIVAERSAMETQFDEVVRMDIEDKNTSLVARELRLKIRDNRTKGIEVWHKTTKDFFLKGGQFVDAIKRKEIAVNERMEDALEQIEKHAQIKEAQRKESLKNARLIELEIYKEFVPMGINLGELSDDEYAKVFNGSKLQYEAKIEADRKAEADRIAKEQADKQRIEAQRVENERLKKEAEAKEKERQAEAKKQAEILAKQKAESDKKLKAEKEAREKVEAELELKRQAEAKIEADKLEAEKKRIAEEKKQAKAPIKTKLYLAISGLELSLPESEISEEIISKFNGFKTWATKEIEKL